VNVWTDSIGAGWGTAVSFSEHDNKLSGCKD